ncbi:hypothetical protein GW17_00029648 [Ensete ventricosum]|nr:hypothetical protein GW17_00029648 [Ensete ventricosum]
MDGGSAGHYNPRTVEEVFRDFKGRRAAMIKALTTGQHTVSLAISHSTHVEDFYQQCHPGEKRRYPLSLSLFVAW